jgi:hypothetical protein
MYKMASFIRKLKSGTKDVERMFETSASIGIDLIEVIWTKSARQSDAMIAGFFVPVIAGFDVQNVTFNADSWVEGSVKFYLDERNNCWGYIYDTPENRKLIYGSLSSGWFKIVDKRIREEIIKEADALGFKTTVTPQTEVNVKKTSREINAEKQAKALEAKLEQMAMEQEMLKKELEMARNERQVQIANKLKGKPVIKEDIEVN